MKGKKKERGKLRIHLAQIRATVSLLSLLHSRFSLSPQYTCSRRSSVSLSIPVQLGRLFPSIYMFMSTVCSPQYTCSWPSSVPLNIPVPDRRLFPSIYLFMTVVCSPQYTCSWPSSVPLNIPVHDHRLFSSIYLFMSIVCSPVSVIFVTNRSGVPAAVSTEDYKQYSWEEKHIVQILYFRYHAWVACFCLFVYLFVCFIFVVLFCFFLLLMCFLQ